MITSIQSRTKVDSPTMGESYIYPDRILDEMIINSVMRSRTIYFKEEFDRESCFKLNYWLNRIKEMDESEGIPLGKRKSIEIVISSYGGIIYEGLGSISLVQYFKNTLKYEIITTVSSTAMSMGFLLAIVGSKKRAYKFATLLCHQPSGWTGYELQKQEEDIEETKRLWNISKKIIIDNSLITDEQLEDIKYRKFDWVMDSETALKLGVIDEILG